MKNLLIRHISIKFEYYSFQELGMVTLEERRHQADMTQVFRIVHGYDNVNAAQCFTGLNSERVTRRAADPLNLTQYRSRLDLRRNFFFSKSDCRVERCSARTEKG